MTIPDIEVLRSSTFFKVHRTPKPIASPSTFKSKEFIDTEDEEEDESPSKEPAGSGSSDSEEEEEAEE